MAVKDLLFEAEMVFGDILCEYAPSAEDMCSGAWTPTEDEIKDAMYEAIQQARFGSKTRGNFDARKIVDQWYEQEYEE